MKQYLLFSWDQYYPGGGWNDIVCTADQLSEIIDFLMELSDSFVGHGRYAHFQFVDCCYNAIIDIDLMCDYDDNVDAFIEGSIKRLQDYGKLSSIGEAST